ncbi:hypothetical protein MKW94_016867 [Papaver nudicaule]|uniref:Transmembrane protein n=1 Tax=Papaver nudicaule TaxID=74823 RepID=A0AA42B3I1_PAPNU|nr:hypothetical protein [Papaver nudicaule]
MAMALNFGSVASLHPNLSQFVSKKHNHHLFFFFSKPSSSSSSSNSIHFYSSSSSSPFTVAIHSEGSEGEVTDDDEPPGLNGSVSSARTQLDLLEQLSSASDGASNRLTIREQLLELVGDREGEDFSIQLGKKNLKKVSANFLTTSQKRNIKRKAYLDDVSRRNDTFFFSSIAAFVIIPPIVILVVAVLTGYLQLLP